MSYLYVAAPVIGWLASGIVKFCINYCRFGSRAFQLVGNGGFPSTHTTVISSVVMLIGFTQGFQSPLCGLGMAVMIITVIDAMGLRRAVGRQAAKLNRHFPPEQEGEKPLRERQGHHPVEVFGGWVLGTIIAIILSKAGSF